jgi:hypothetical protein
MLRQFPELTCIEACGGNGPSIITSFEPLEDWFFDYEKQEMIKAP